MLSILNISRESRAGYYVELSPKNFLSALVVHSALCVPEKYSAKPNTELSGNFPYI